MVKGVIEDMKCPKYIEDALNKREKAAYMFNHYDWMVSNWCDKHNVPLETYDCYGGCESLVNPSHSTERVLEAIKNT